MTVTSFEGKAPVIGEGCWVHPSAEVIGDVRLGARCWNAVDDEYRADPPSAWYRRASYE